MTHWPVAWEWVALVVALAVCGVVAVSWLAVAGIRQACEWVADWLQGRVDPPWWWKPWLYRRSPNPDYDGDGWDWPDDGPGGDDELEWGAAEFDLPPERSREDLGFTRPPQESSEVQHWRRLERARMAAGAVAEAEHRAAYESLGFDYPSGLMARVRELAP